ncbi:uncharacterized protein LOC144060258 isoform X2 [Vanacampus margaritifer]
MESLAVGWTVHTCDQDRDGAVLLKGGNSTNTNHHEQDLFHEDAQGSQQSSQPWWRIKLFVWEPILFGTWDGVFTTCMINIFGVVLFLRTGYLVGNTGVLLGMLLVSMVVLFALVTVMSGIGVCEYCGVGSGGVYSMISTVLGGRVGGTMGLLYVFGQCVASAMYITGFSESVAQLLALRSQWAVRGMSAAVLLALLGINLAGVKWIVRLQLLLLAVLAVSTLDFVIGTFTHLDPAHGFVGYSVGLLSRNALPDYTPGENFFTVFGVFFPAATGVMSGFNMSSDLQRAEHNIPLGTLAAVFTSWFLYLVFVFLLGAICTREALRCDFLIAEKVSLVGFLFLLGLYVSSLASCMGGLYGAPRILQCIAQEKVIPALAFLGRGVNVLAPIVTINFMLTYSFIDYSYFCVVMAFQLKNKDKGSQQKFAREMSTPLIDNSAPDYGSGGESPQRKGTLMEFTKDMDRIFPSASSGVAGPEKSSQGRGTSKEAKQKLMDSFGLDLQNNAFADEQAPEFGKTETSSGPHSTAIGGRSEQHNLDVKPQPDSVYAKFSNHVMALIGALSSLLIMFAIQWAYALANIGVALLLFFYIGKTSPGLHRGVAARFSFFVWLKSTLNSICRRGATPRDEMVVTPSLSGVGLQTKQLTEENADFASRNRYHQSSFIRRDEMVQSPHGDHRAGFFETMKTWLREPVLGLFLWGLAFTLPRPLGAGTPINSSPDAGTTAVYSPSSSSSSEASNTDYDFTSSTSPSSESSAPPSQEDLLLARSADTERTQTRRETGTRSLQTVFGSTEPVTSSLVGTSSEASRDWREASQTQNLPDISTGVSNKVMFTEDSSLLQDSPVSHLRLGDTVSSPSQFLTDSIFTSTTISRAGERTLLSVTSSSSNSSSSSAFTEHSGSHQPPSTWSIPSTGGAETEDYTHSAPSTRSEETRGSSLAQSSLPESSTGSQSLVGPPNTTEHQHILTSEATSHSTPRMSTTDQLDESFSSTPPFVPPVRSPTLASYQEPTAEPSAESSTETVSFSTQTLSQSTEESSSESVGFIFTTAPPLISSTTNQYESRKETTEVFITTTAVTVTERSEVTAEDTSTSTMSASTPLLLATSAFRLSSTSIISTPESPTQAIIPSTTPATSAPTLPQQSSATPTAPLSNTNQAPSSPVAMAEPTDVTTPKQETSAGTLGVTTPTQSQLTTAPHALRSPTRSTEVVYTTRKQKDRLTTEGVTATTTTRVLPTTAAPTTGDPCMSNPCMNGGACLSYERRHFTCRCQQAWTGPTCNQDMDECEKDPCPVGSRCVNTRGSFNCECPLGFDLEDGRTCTKAKTFLGTFSVNRVSHDPSVFKSATMHEIQREIIQLLNASLSHFRGYSRSTLSKKEHDGVHISTVNMFSTSSDVTSAEVHDSIQMFLKNCSSSQSHCHVVTHHKLTYHVESLCVAQKIQCNPERSTCTDVSGTAHCQCLAGYYKHNLDDLSCLECGDGYKLENGTCVSCMFGFGGFNCGNFYKLIAVVVSPAGGALLLILIIALIVTCCKRDKNDLNKIIFKSGDLQMSPYTDFPKSNRISMEWGRETIEMQENGSTKNLLQMTDIYYSPALRNADLERNGLYPFTGLPGSRHSCIYPAQWNPSFTSDDSRRRDYF